MRLNFESKKIKSKSRQLEEINNFLSVEKSRYKQLASTDPLTKTLNREGIRPSIESAMTNWKENKQVAALIMLDIDDFKSLNDTHGHDAGDEVLQKVSEVLKSNIRATDKLARWGGEEFIIISENTNIDDALKLTEKLRMALEKHDFQYGKITASFGVSLVQNNIEPWFKKADNALYSAKKQGKNKVQLAVL